LVITSGKKDYFLSTIQENGRVIICSELLEKHYRALLLSSKYNHHVYTKAPAFIYSFHELGDEASLVGIAAILPELCLLIQQYFDIVDYIGSLYG
jgi:hypothetical protein